MGGGDVAQLIERQVGTLLTRVQLHGTASSFQSHLSAHTLLRCPYSPHVQSRSLKSLPTLRIPSIGSHTIGLERRNTALNGRSRENYFRNFGVSLQETNRQDLKKKKKNLPSKNTASSTQNVGFYLRDVPIAAFCILMSYFMESKMKKISIDSW